MTTASTVVRIAIALVGFAATTEAQTGKISGRFPPAIELSIQTLIDSARENGLPTEPLVQRALEGASRGADPNRVVTAVRAFAARLATARRALGPVSEPELVAAASAIYLGVLPERLTQLRQSAEGSLALPLVVLTDFVAQGVPMDTATSIMLSLTSAGVTEARLRELRQSVLLDIRSGMRPTTAASVRARGALVERRAIPPPAAARRRPVAPPRE